MMAEHLLAAGELTLRETQLASLEVLKQIDRVCSQLGLSYYLAHGSLLGAVRHGGFIPWDDDLDIAMSRPDYNRLLEFFDNNASNLFPLVAVHNTESRKLPFLITRISDVRYKEVGEYSYDAPEMGVFVDIYPLDGAGNNSDEAVLERKNCWKLIIDYLRAGNFVSNNISCGLLKRTAKKLRSFFYGACDRYEKMLINCMSIERYDNSDYVACLVWGIPQILELVIYKGDLGKGLLVPFEDFSARIPIGYDAILRSEYGDYMTLPPKEQRVGHHSYSIVARNQVEIDALRCSLFGIA